MSTPTAPAASAPLPTTKKKVDFRSAKKAIEHQHLELRISDTLTERYSLLYLPPSDPMSTACWHHEKGGRGEPPRHIITFGENLAQNKREGCDLGDYAKAYHRHELAHSLWTERDLPALNTACEAVKIPFSMLNVFEDARIEHKWRQEFDERFEWSFYEEIKPVDPKQEVPDRALGAMMAMIQCEGDETLLADALKDIPEAADVRELFYDKAIEATDAKSLIPLMQEFVGKYGMPKNLEQPQGGARATAGDMTAGLTIATDEKKRAELHASEKASSSEKEEPNGGAQIGTKSEAKTVIKGTVLTRKPTFEAVDPVRVRRIVDTFTGVFRTGPQKYKRETPSKRISVRDFVLERPRFYKAVEESAPYQSRVNVIFDCSGSMAATDKHGMRAVVAGRHLVLAMGELARANVLTGDLILSVLTCSQTRHEVIPLREVTEAIVPRIGAYGDGEGLAPAMDLNTQRLLEADCTLVYTDGNITDTPINRALWHRRGVFTIGCYVGDASRCEKMRNWFDAPLCRETIENLALAVAQVVRQKASIRQGAKLPGVSRVIEIPVAAEEPVKAAVGV